MTTTLALIINAGLATATITGLALLMTRMAKAASNDASRDALPHGVPSPPTSCW